MAKSTTLLIRIIADASQAYKGLSKFGKAMVPATAAAAGITAALTGMAKSAADDAKGQALLKKSLQNTTAATDAQVAGVEDWIAKTAMATGVADDELRPAMSALARSTGDVATAQQAMGVALDVAAATGKDTQSVANAMSKAYAGNTTALGRLVPGLDKAVVKSGDMSKIMGELSRMTGGSAAAAADTAAGKFQRASLAFDEAKESAGAALLPVLSALGSKLVAVGKFASDHTAAIQTLALVFGGLAASVYAINAAYAVYTAYTKAATIATKLFSKEGLAMKAWQAAVRVGTLAWAAAQWLLNVAMSANPIGIIIIAIIALVAAIVIAYKKSATFRAIVQAAFKGIATAAKAVANAVVAAWNWVKAGLLRIWQWINVNVIQKLVAAFFRVRATARAVTSAVVSTWEGVKSAMYAVYTWIKQHVIDPMVNLFNKVVDAVKGVIDWIKNIKIPAPVQKIIDKVGGVFGRSARAVIVPPAPAVGRRAARATTPTNAARNRPDDALSINVYLDGRRVAGVIDRVVTRRLDAEGARALAGSWA